MSDEPLKVVVLGSGNTGSGAIFDYLKNRSDFKSPLTKEFRLIQDPGGIVDLHSSIVFDYYINRASSAVKDFINLSERTGKSKKGYPKGLNYRKDVANYDEKIGHYIRKICSVEYSGMPFCERSKLPYLKAFFYNKKRRFAKKRDSKPQDGKMYIPVTEKEFLIQTKLFLDSIFETKGSSKSIVINQGGSFWSPKSSTQYYGDNTKAIVVTRDPRAIFSSFKTKGYAYPGGEDVKLFCEWFKAIMCHVDYDEWNTKNVMQVQFEEFVLNYSEEKKKLNEFLGISDELTSEVEIRRSAFNSKKFYNRLTDAELKVIEDMLSDYLFF